MEVLSLEDRIGTMPHSVMSLFPSSFLLLLKNWNQVKIMLDEPNFTRLDFFNKTKTRSR